MKRLCLQILRLRPRVVYFEYFCYQNRKKDENIEEANKLLKKCIAFLRGLGLKVKKLSEIQEERSIAILLQDSKKKLKHAQKLGVNDDAFRLCIGEIHCCKFSRRLIIQRV